MKTGRLSSRSGSLLLAAVLSLFLWEIDARAEGTVYTMPVNCNELLPDNTPFLNYFEAH